MLLYVHTGLVLIRGARQLLTLRGPGTPRCGPQLNELNIIQDGSLLIRDGVLHQVNTTRRVENLAEARRAVEINAAGRVVMPGFVDCHTHLAYPPPGVPDADHAAAVRVIAAATGKGLAIRWQAQLEAMARHGTTTAEIKTGVSREDLAGHKLLRTLAKLKNQPLDIVSTLLFRLPMADGLSEAESAEFTDWVCSDLLPRLHARKLIRFADVAWDAAATRQRCIRRYLTAARTLGFGCKMHAEQHSMRAAIVMAIEHLAVSVDHLEQATNSDVSLIAGSGTMATLLPCASFHTGAGNAPARALVDAGVPIALGTNFHPRYSPTLNMQAVVALACARLGLTPAEAVSAATINGAHALGCASRAGSLEPGKLADIAILNISDYRDLANHFGGNLVHATMKRGDVIYREGEVGVRKGLRDAPVLH